MLIKYQSLKKPKFGKLLRYIFRNHPSGIQNRVQGYYHTHNIRGNTLGEWEAAFLENEQFRRVSRSNSIKARHIIMSFHPNDAPFITPEILLDLARHFIQLYTPKAMYVSTIHFDTDHVHVHIMCSGIEYRTGKTIRHSKKEFQKIKQRLEHYQTKIYPQLTHSVVHHGKTRKGNIRTKDSEYRIKQRTRSPTKKEELYGKLTESLQTSTTASAFWQELKNKRIQPYMRGGKIIGVIYGKRKFRFKTLGLERQIRELTNQRTKRTKQGWER